MDQVYQMKSTSRRLLYFAAFAGIVGGARDANAAVTTAITADAGAIVGTVRGASLQGNTTIRTTSKSVGIGLKLNINDSPISIGAVAEIASLRVPSLGARQQLVALKLRLDVRVFKDILPARVISEVGCDMGAHVMNGGVGDIFGAHIAAGYTMGLGVTLVVRGEYDVLTVPYGGTCDTASPIAGCGYGGRAARAALGLEYAF